MRHGTRSVECRAHHDGSSLLRMAAWSHTEIDVGSRHIEVLEERSTHALVVVLTGMDELQLKPAIVACQRAEDWRSLHEIGTGPDYGDDAHQDWDVSWPR